MKDAYGFWVLLVIGLYLLAAAVWVAESERRTHTFRDLFRRYISRPPAETFVIAAFFFSSIYAGGTKPSGGTNGTSPSVSSANAVLSSSWSVAVSNRTTGALTLYSRSLLSGEGATTATQRLTAAQYAARFALVRVLTNSAPWLSVPSNAVTHAPWTRYGVAEDTFWLPATGWSFALGSNSVAGAHVSSSGTLSFGRPKGSPRAAEMPDGTGLDFLAPLQSQFGTVPPQGRFWHAATDSNSVLFTWENVFAGRDTRSPVTFQAELFRNGDFVYRYAFTNAPALTNFVIGAQHNNGGETYAFGDTNLLANGLELRWRAFGILDPGIDDHDGDGLSTYDEIMRYGTDPSMPDTDLDGLSDAAEIAAGLNPLARFSNGSGFPDGSNPQSLPWSDADADANGLPDDWERYWFGTNGTAGASADANGDGFSNLANLLTGTDPAKAPPPGFAVTNAVLADGLDAWEIAPAFALDIPAGMTNVLARTIPAARTSPWQQFFVSSKPGAAGAWALDGLVLSWEAGTGAAGAVAASPSDDSLRLALGSNLFAAVSVRIDPARASGLLRSPAPLYLIRWTPRPAFETGGGVIAATSSNGVPCVAAVLESVGAAALPFTFDASARPHRTDAGADELAERSLPPDPGSAVRPLFSGDSAGWLTADGPAQAALPASGTNIPVRVLLYTTAVVSSDGTALTRPFGQLLPAYPLDTAALRTKWRASSDSASSPGFTVRTGIDSEFLTVSVNGVPGSSYSWDGGVATALARTAALSATASDCGDCNGALVGISLCGSNVWSDCVEREPGNYQTDEDDDPQDAPPCDCTSGCGCSDICDCAEGDGLGSLKFRIPFGVPGRGQVSGFLWAALETPVAVTPALFNVLGCGVSASTNAGTVTFACADNNGATLTMETAANGVRISVRDAYGVYDHRWEIANPDGDAARIRLVRRDSAGNAVADATYAYTAGGSGSGLWVRSNALDGSQESLALSGGLETGGARTENRGALSASGAVLSARQAVRETVGIGAAAVSRVTQSAVWDAASGVWRTTLSDYWEDSARPSRNGKLRYRRGGAPWEYHAWDARGREVLRAVQAGGSAAPDASSLTDDLRTPEAVLAAVPGTACTVTTHSYVPDAANGDTADYNDSREPRETAVCALRDGSATVISREWRVYARGSADGIGTVSVRTVRAASASSAYADAANAASLSVAYAGCEDATVPAALRDLPLREESEDGAVRTWAYALTGYDGVNGTLTVTERSGTTANPDGVPGLSTYTVETRDAAYGLVLRRETRLCTGEGDGPLLSWEQSGYDAKRRLLGTSYSDGTSLSNIWSCCRLESSVGRDGTRTEYDAVPGDSHWSRTSQASLGSLPGADGRFPAAEKFTDALGRETNSVRAVMSNGSRDAAYGPLATRTEYPYGTDGYSVTTDPLGVRTVSRTYYADNAKITETASAGVTNRTTEVFGGATVSEKFWDGKWTRETRSASYGADGCRAETVLAESSDYPAVTKSVTAYDFLGRVVSVTTPLGVTSNFYANGRLVRVTRTGSPGTLYAYDALGNVSVTTLDVDGDGQVSYAGSDQISSTATDYEEFSNEWWRVIASAVWHQTGVDASLTASVSRVRMTGLGGAAPAWVSANAILTAQSMTVDGHGNATLNSTYTDAGSASVWQVSATPFSTQAVIRVSKAGNPVTDISASFVTNTYTYDGFARKTAATDGRGNTARTAYNSFGQTEYTEDAASNRTAYTYDELGRQASVSSPLSNTVFTVYDSLGNVIRTWGATYPVEYGYDSQGRKISMKTFRVENGNGDETLWIYNNVTGLLTNKVYADGKGTAYGFTSTGRLATRTLARGVTTSYAYDATGQLTGIDYSDSTPDVTFAYDRLGRMTSATTPVSTNLFGYSGFDLVTETQNGVTITRSYDNLGRSAGFNMGSAYIAAYAYDTFGRFASVSSSVASASSVASYSYLTGSGLVASMTNSSGFSWARVYEQNRDLIASVENDFAANPVSAYGYENDADGRRTLRIDTTPALSVTNSIGYNERAEVTNAVMGASTYGYGYDDIGNRLFSSFNADTNTYTANQLNQYSNIGEGTPIMPVYDEDGNMTSYGPWTYTWDAENRLASAASNGVVVVTNVYDHISRRIAKLSGEAQHTFLYDGWNPIREMIAVGGSVATNYYIWGLDFSSSLQGTGGVGGLLAVHSDEDVYFPAYDANGNITAYLGTNGAVVAQREYDNFGNTVSCSGSMAGHLAYWFSTKYLDAETEMYGYVFRFYHPGLGRWASRDPTGEVWSRNLYGFLDNSPPNAVDPFGLVSSKFTEKDGNPLDWGAQQEESLNDHGCECKKRWFKCEYYAECRLKVTSNIRLAAAGSLFWTSKTFIPANEEDKKAWLANPDPNSRQSVVYNHELRHRKDFRAWFNGEVRILEAVEAKTYASMESCEKDVAQIDKDLVDSHVKAAAESQIKWK